MHRILIAEDEIVTLTFLDSLLKNAGYDVVGEATSGIQAVEIAAIQKPDLAIMDIEMPGELDGIKAAEIIYDTAGIPIIFLTAHREKRVIEQAKAVNPYGYLIKPFIEKDLLTTLDIVLHKIEIDKKLLISEEKYRTLTENLNTGVFRISTDPNGKFIEVNDALVNIFGYRSKQELYNLNAAQLFQNPADLNQFNQKILTTGFVKNEEIAALRKDGIPIIVAVSFIAVKDDKGHINYFDGTVEDITEHKQAEEALKDSEDRLKVAQKIAELGYYVLNIKTGYWTSSDELDAIFGIAKKYNRDVSGWLQLVHPDFVEKMSNYLQDNVLTQHQEFDKEYKIINQKTGHEKWVHGLGNLKFDENNNPVEMFGTIQDITKHKQAEETLEKRTRNLSERVKELNCLYGISNLVNKPGISSDQIYQGVADLIPPSWQYPEITCARIIVKEKEYRTNNFKKSKWLQSRDIIVHNEVIGVIEIAYMEEMPVIHEGPFLKEERSLIDAIAQRLGKTTERKLAEETLRESEERFRTAFENANDGVCLVDTDGNLVRVNNRMCDIFGYSKKELESMAVNDIAHPEDKDISPKFIEKSISGEVESAVFEKRYLHKQGRIIWGQVSSSIIKDAKGDPLGFVSHVQDITQRMQAEQALRIERDNLNNIFEAMEDGVYIVKQQYDIQYVNPVLIKDFGIYEGRKCYEYFHDRKEACSWCKNPEVFAGKTVHWEWYSSKNQRTYDLIDTPLKNPDGSVSKLEIFRDITERKQAEEALQKVHDELEERVVKRTKELNSANKELKKEIIVRRRTELVIKSERDYLERLRNSVGEVILTVGLPDRIITHVNKQIKDIFGYTVEESVGNTTEMFYTSRKAFLKYSIVLKNAMETDEDIIQSEQIFKKKNGETFNAEVTTSFLKENNNISQVISIVRDVTKRKQIEARIKSSLKEKEVLLSEVHHRVKNNLEIIIGLYDMAIMQMENQRDIDLIEEIGQKIKSIAMVHTQLYQSEQFDKIDIVSHIIDLTDQIEGIYGSGKDILISVEGAELYLPLERAIPCGLIISELITNAYKHGFKDIPAGEIKIAVRLIKNQSVKIQVKNDGNRITNLDEVFKKDTAIGLELIKTMVEKQLNGSIKLKTSPITDFTIAFPQTRKDIK